MGCNCHNDSTPLSIKQKMRREVKKKIADIKKIWQESSDVESDNKITTKRDKLGFKPI